MLLHVAAVLSPEELGAIQAALAAAPWEDGRRTAGHHARGVKRNLQLPAGLPEAERLGGIVADALARHPAFLAAALPLRMLPPRFNLYEDAGEYGDHVDNAVMPVAGTGTSVRSDVSITVFLSDPDGYDGGELVIRDTFGEHRVKLPAGDAILYPAGSLHRVTPVTRGRRLAAFLWAQSLVPQDHRRRLLHDLDLAIQSLGTDHPEHGAVATLTGLYHNLLREWAQT